MTTTPEWISIIAPFASGAFGIGVGWGILRQKINEIDKRVNKTENRLEKQVGSDRCDVMRHECKETICDNIIEVKKDVSELRSILINKVIPGVLTKGA